MSIDRKIDVVSFSNVLEHIKDRIGLLKHLINTLNPKRFLIRVPSYERDWRVPLKDEYKVDYRLDPTHYIEYTRDKFYDEMQQAGLKIISYEQKWGEIYSVLAAQ